MKMCPKCDACYEDSTLFCPRDGTELVTIAVASQLPEGAILDSRYEIETEVGKGSLGTVYRAIQLSTGRRVAVKVIHPILSKESATLKRFQKEVRAATRLSHPGIVEILDFGLSSSGLLYLVMEYVEGEHLKKVIAEIGALSVELSLSIMRQVLKAVAAAHRAGVIHRDLKPSNIILLKHGKPHQFIKILDFGIAQIYGDDGSALVDVAHSPYVSPEVAAGQNATASSDIYSLGVIFYEMLSGVLPFPTDSAVSLSGHTTPPKPLPIRRIKPYLQVPWRVERMVLRALDQNPQRRYPTAEHFLKDVMACSSPTLSWLKATLVLAVILALTYSLGQYYSQNVHQALNWLWQLVSPPHTKKVNKHDQPTNSRGSVSQVSSSLPASNQQAPWRKTFQERLKQLRQQGQQRPIKSILRDMLFVRGGTAIIGSENGDLDERPCRRVKIQPFFIDRCEVTNEQYAAFIKATGHHPPAHWHGRQFPVGKARHPVVGVTWFDAVLYAAWQGKRLPTEIENEVAARGFEIREWPWGNHFDRRLCNVGRPDTLPVGSFPQGASPFGVLDMAGNVWEWTASWYHPNHLERTIRGGSFRYSAFQARTSYREGFKPEFGRNDIGFRCVRSAKK